MGGRRRDNLTLEQRSYCMSRVKGKNTGLERLVRSALHKRGYRFQKHPSGLPGKPDIVFPRAKVAVFVDGDFWHGYRFPLWRETMSDFWQRKIAANRDRDRRNFARLRDSGWRVLRVWQHQVKGDLETCVQRIVAAVQSGRVGNP
jgi:DNA mismatch endonuclease (patch repair protein)